MGKQRNFPQSVGGNDSRVCRDESRDASRLREYKRRGGGGGEEKCDSLIARVFHGPNAGKFLERHCAVDLTLRGDKEAGGLSLISR